MLWREAVSFFHPPALTRMNGNGDYLTKWIPNGRVSNPGLAFQSEAKTGLCLETGTNSAMTMVKKGKKRLRISDTETALYDSDEVKRIRITDDSVEVTGPLVVDDIVPGSIVLTRGTAADPSLSFTDSMGSGIYYSTSPHTGVAISSEAKENAIFESGNILAKNSYGFIDNVCGVRTVTAAPGIQGLTFNIDNSGSPVDILTLKNDISSVASSRLNATSYGFNGGMLSQMFATASGSTESVITSVKSGPSATVNGLTVTPTIVYAGDVINPIDIKCRDLTVRNVGCQSLLSTGTMSCGTNAMTSGALTSSSIQSSGTISCGTNSMTCGALTSSSLSASNLFSNSVMVTTSANNILGLQLSSSFTPNIGDGTNAFTLSFNNCRYCRIGPLVVCNLQFIWTSKGSAVSGSDLVITGLPLSTFGDNYEGYISVVSGTWTTTGMMCLQMTSSGTTQVNVYQTLTTGASSKVTCGAAPSSGGLRGQIYYFTA